MIPVPSATDIVERQRLWTHAAEELRRIISAEEVGHWFRDACLIDCQNGTVSVGVESQSQKAYIEQNYDHVLQEVFTSLLQRNVNVAIQVFNENETLLQNGLNVSVLAEPIIESYDSEPPNGQAMRQYEPINEFYTFDTFVIGASNKMASAAAEAVADAPARSYNPLFLYGGVGLGKTHLMQAIGNKILQHKPHHQVVYLSAEQFVNTFIDSIRRNERLSFQNTFRNFDVLLIDDIQFLAGKESTQEEFFHTFNALHNRQKQIVISSDRPPKDIPTIEDRLRSRFEWGLIVDIGPPDFELRMAILRKKCEKLNVVVQDDVLEFIASKIRTSIRELEGALQKVCAHSQLTKSPLDVETAGKALGELFDRPVKEISIEKIQRAVADYFNIKPSDIIGKNRSRSIARPRQIAMYLSRNLTRHSFPEIGTFFGNKDHTTVLFACNKIEKELELDDKLRSTVQRLKDTFALY